MAETKKKKKIQNNSAKSSPRVIAAKKKAAEALELRKEGKSFSEIAEELGYRHKQSAHSAVMSAIRDITREPAEEVIKLDLERLDAIWQVTYLNACAGDVAAIGACMRIMERRAKLLGLDAPEKKDISGDVQVVPVGLGAFYGESTDT